MILEIVGIDLPGRHACHDGKLVDNVHVGVQRGREPVELVPADASRARWVLDVDVVEREGRPDFRGPWIQGRPGERFVYLTWGDVDGDGTFAMFRRAKLVLDRVPGETVDAAVRSGRLRARVRLTGRDGGPLCARVDPPAVVWDVPVS